MRPVAQAGDEAGYLESIAVTWADTPLGRGPTGTAIRTGRPVVGRSFLTDPELAPWRAQAIQHGFASSLAVPLRADGRAFGALTIYATAPDAFSAENVELLAGLADDLAFGIAMLRERATAGEGLRRSERNLAEAQRIAHIGSWEWDLAADTAQRSEEVYRIVGVEPGAFPATTEGFLAWVHPDDRARVRAAELATIRNGGRHDIEFRIVRPDGSVRIVHEQGELVRDPSGVATRLVGTVQDITERVELEAQQLMLARLLDEVSSEIYVLDAETLRFTGANAGALRNLGFSLEELSKLTPLDLAPELSPEVFADCWLRSVPARASRSPIETIGTRRDGSTYPVEVRVHHLPKRDAAGLRRRHPGHHRAGRRERGAGLARLGGRADRRRRLDAGRRRLREVRQPLVQPAVRLRADEIVGRYAGIVNSGLQEKAFFDAIWAAVASGRRGAAGSSTVARTAP